MRTTGRSRSRYSNPTELWSDTSTSAATSQGEAFPSRTSTAFPRLSSGSSLRAQSIPPEFS